MPRAAVRSSIASSILLAAGLATLALAHSLPVYLMAWLLMGVGMGSGLYDAGFATLGRLYGKDARRAITTLTLWGGFASTVCWPLSAWLVEHFGWRGACAAYAAIHVLVSPSAARLRRARHRVGCRAAAGHPARSPDCPPRLL